MTPRQALQVALDDEHTDAIIAHRKAKRCPLTPRAAQLLASEFSKTGDANNAADEMLIRGWQGFKASWLEPQANRSLQPRLTNLDMLELDLADRIRNGTGSQGSLDFASIPRLSGR